MPFASRPRSRTVRLVAAMTLAAACCPIGACAPGPARPQPPVRVTAAAASAADAAGESARLLRAILAEIGDAACDSDAQCHSIGVGAKPCGGPEAYLSWSELRSNPERLRALVQQHREARRADNERSGVTSDCRVVPDPGALCRPRAQDGKRVCQPGGAAAGAASGAL